MSMFSINSLSTSWRPYATIAAVGSLLYAHTLTFTSYTHFDDYTLIVRSYPHLDEWSDIGRAFFQDVFHAHQGGNIYRPILTISLILNAQMSGIDPLAYRVTNILFHIAAVCLLFTLLRSLSIHNTTALAIALIFCVHPALTQSVVWIPGRNDSMLAVFVLAAFLMLQNFRTTSKPRWYFLHVLFFFLALFTKESALALIILCLVYLILTRREKPLTMHALALLAGWGVVIVNWQILRWVAMIYPIQDWGYLVSMVLGNSWASVMYIGKMFWPFHLAYGPVADDLPILPGVLSTLGLVIAFSLAEKRDWKMIAFGALWFFAFLLPTFYMHKSPFAGSGIRFYEHRLYVPSIGILLSLLSVSWPRQWIPAQGLRVAATVALTIFLSALSAKQSFHFKDSLSMREYAARTSPHDVRLYASITRMHLPTMLWEEFFKLRKHGPDHKDDPPTVSRAELDTLTNRIVTTFQAGQHSADRHHALAALAFAKGWLMTGEQHLQTALTIEPDNPTTHYNFGVLYYEARAEDRAEAAWKKAIALNDSLADAHHNLAYLLYSRKEYHEAWKYCQKALALGAAVAPELVKEIHRRLEGPDGSFEQRDTP